MVTLFRLNCLACVTDSTNRPQHNGVKAHLDELIGVWDDTNQHRDAVQDKMMKDYDKHYRELKGMKAGQLVMVEAKHISVPAKKVKGVMDSEKLVARLRSRGSLDRP
eukprot:COSAG06_NODE_249_length_19140_cov_18.998004_4_plen_107_part_00